MIRRMRRPLALAAAAVVVTVVLPGPGSWAAADAYALLSGSGSTWAQNAVDQWRRDIAELDGLTVYYAGNGSTAGRRDFIDQVVDFAVTDIPFQTAPEDGSAPETPPSSFASVPTVGGGLALMYNLEIDGERVTDLRLSGEAVAGIFSGKITRWNDPAIRADNPGVAMPDRAITPVYRADSSATSLQLTSWMADRYPDVWTMGAVSQFPSIAPSFTDRTDRSGSAGS